METNKVVEVIDALCEKFGLAIDWTSQNIVPYIEQLCVKFVKYEIATSIAWISVFVVFTLAAFIFAKYCSKKGDEYDYETIYDGLSIVGWIVFGIGLLVSVVGGVKQVMDIIECVTFPEKFIFEYISSAIQQ